MLLAVGVARQKYPPTPKLILFKKVKDKINYKLEQKVFFNKLSEITNDRCDAWHSHTASD